MSTAIMMRRKSVARGGLIAVALIYVGVLLVAPIAGIVWSLVKGGAGAVASTFAAADVRHAFWLTGIITVITVATTAVFGVLTAWILTRHRFPGKSLVESLVDLPLAVSPVTVGLMAFLLFGTEGLFQPFLAAHGIQILFAVSGMALVTIFICVPFVIREVAPVLEELGTEEEDAARTLGASSFQSFRRVTLPNIRSGLLFGIALTAARAMGEIGAVLIVSGAIQGQTETATLFIFRALEERQDTSAFVVAMTLAAVSVLLLAAIEIAQARREKEAR